MVSNSVVLPKELTIFTVEDFWKILVEVIEKMNKKNQKHLVLNFEEMEKIDGSGIQLLLSLEKTMLKEKFSVNYENINDETEKIFRLIGVDYLLVTEGETNE